MSRIPSIGEKRHVTEYQLKILTQVSIIKVDQGHVISIYITTVHFVLNF